MTKTKSRDQFLKIVTQWGLLKSRSTSSRDGSTLGVLEPKTTEQVRKLVKLANKYKIPLHPVSQGKNWGFGGSLPPKAPCFLVTLHCLNKIHKVDLKHGYAVIGPGVTQEDLLLYLSKQKTSWSLDPTGIFSKTSIIGNCLERGIAATSLRAESLLKLELILGNGEKIETGFQNDSRDEISHLYPYGVGPSLDGLFFQSNFGIVTKATIKLKKISDIKILIFEIPTAKDLELLVDEIPWLRALPGGGAPSRIFDQAKFHSLFLTPLQELHPEWNYQKLSAFLKKTLPAKWVGVGFIERKQIRKILPHIKRRLPGILIHAEDTFYSSFLSQAAPKLKTFPFLEAPVQGAHWLSVGKSLLPTQSFADSEAGLLFYAPLLTRTATHLKESLRTIQRLRRKYSLPLAVSINPIQEQILELVIAIHFDRANALQTKKAPQCLKELNQEFRKRGFLPYRLPHELVTEELYPKNYRNLLLELKKVFDPNGILSPGRYGID